MVLLGVFLLSALAMAQITGFNQRGRATQELKAEGFGIAHPSLPLNSKVMIANNSTGKAIEVVVVGRIPASSSRIADISPGAWQDLDLNPDTEITIFTVAPLRPQPFVTVQPAVPMPPAAEITRTEAAPVTGTTRTEAVPAAGTTRVETIREVPVAQPRVGDTQATNQPNNITINNYVTVPEQRASQEIVREAPGQAQPAAQDLTSWLLAMEYRQAVREAAQPAAPVVVNVNPNMTQQVPINGILPQEKASTSREIAGGTPPEAPPAQTDPEILTRLTALEAIADEYTPLALPAQTDPEILTRLTALEAIADEYTPLALPVQTDPEILTRLKAMEDRQEALEAANTKAAAQAIPVTQPEKKEPDAIAGEPSRQPAPIDPEILTRLKALEERQEVLEAANTRASAQAVPAVQPEKKAPEVITDRPAPQAPRPVHANRHGSAEPRRPEPQRPASVTRPQVIPGLPDPDSGKIYRLQVGTFSTLEAARGVSRLVSSSGFAVMMEQTGSMYRVIAVDVPAALVGPAIQRLGIIGIDQVWVRE